MRLFRPKYKDKDGKNKKVSKWWVELRDHLHTVRRFPGFTDKGQTELLGRQIERLVNYRVAGKQPDAQLSRWLEQIPARLKDRFVSIGLLESTRAAAAKPLKEHLEDFRKSLGSTTKHAKHTVNGIVRTFDACKFGTWTDLSASRLLSYLTDLKTKGDISQRTFNFYLKAAKQFCRWMVKDRRASASPFEHLDCETVTDRRRERRAIEADELRRLLETTRASETRFGMAGFERALLYRLAAETGLRANELRSLKVSSFDFKNLTVFTTRTKNKKAATLPMRPDTAVDLKEFLAGKL
ncbi:MAG: tyrosine-type recombinase/integrase, partial [Planctomycetota bacterium]